MALEQDRPRRSIGRRLALGVGGLLALVLLVALAWLASNVVDADPSPRPAELVRQPPLVPDADNAAYALMGLFAAADRDPATAGRAQWQAHIAFWSLPRLQREWPQSLATWKQAQARSHGTRLSTGSGSAADCEADRGDCWPGWVEQAQAMAQWHQTMAIVGRRCEVLLDGPFKFEEPVPDKVDLAPVFGMDYMLGASSCASWFRTGAVLAAMQGRRDESLAHLMRADRLQRTLLSGSQSLTAQGIAFAISRRTLQTISTLALHDPSMARLLAPLLHPLPDQAQALRRNIRFESAFSQGVLTDYFANCGKGEPGRAPGFTLTLPWVMAAIDGLCSHRIGSLPNLSQQQMDRAWLPLLQALESGGLPGAWRQLRQQPDSGAAGLAWRNTFGANWPGLGGALAHYLPRYIDADLRREVAALAVTAQLQAVPAGQREAWSQQQPISDGLRQRLRWVEAGQTLMLEPLSPGNSPSATPDPRNSIRISWPR